MDSKSKQTRNLQPEGRPGGILGSAWRNVRGCQGGTKGVASASKALNLEPRIPGLENLGLAKTLQEPRLTIWHAVLSYRGGRRIAHAHSAGPCVCGLFGVGVWCGGREIDATNDPNRFPIK